MANKQNLYNDQISEIKDFIEDDLDIIEGMLLDSLKNSALLTHEAASNIFNSGGKRIRPILTIVFAKLFNFSSDSVYNIAAAAELIHTATLLHDDVIDNSMQRRGSKTSNFKYGNKTSILVGDYIFAMSFKYMVKSASLDALNILSNTSAIIANGEIRQLELLEQPSFNDEDYFTVIKSKTAELFAACCQTAAVIAGRSNGEKRMAYDFGLNIGMAFQIIDDLIDYDLSNNYGKNIGDDFYEKKITLPIISLYRILASSERKQIESFFTKDYVLESADLNYIISLLQEKNIFSYVTGIANNYVNNAIKILEAFPQNNANNILKLICKLIINRNK
jgi:octaprenyl-diphosphate synthase